MAPVKLDRTTTWMIFKIDVFCASVIFDARLGPEKNRCREIGSSQKKLMTMEDIKEIVISHSVGSGIVGHILGWFSSGTGMIFLIHRPQMFAANMCINLGGCDLAVAEHELDRPKVCPPL